MGMADLIIANGYVVTMNPERTIFADGAPAIDGKSILAIGPSSERLGRHTASARPCLRSAPDRGRGLSRRTRQFRRDDPIRDYLLQRARQLLPRRHWPSGITSWNTWHPQPLDSG